MLWRFELFGGLQARRGDLEITHFRTQKTAALLAYLAYFPRSHAREFLIELLWPDVSQDSGRNNLRLALSSLRRQLEPPDTPPGSILIANRAWVQLNPAAFTNDVREFEEAIEKARQTGAKEHLKQALELYHGPLLNGFYEDWVPMEETRLEDLLLQTSRRILAICESKGDLHSALQFAHRVAQVTRGDMLQDELQRLRRAIGQSPPPANVPKTIAGSASIPVAESAKNTLTSQSELPPVFTRFFGRDTEVAQLHAFLQDIYVRVVTLTGHGGTGKTRLAHEFGRQWRDAGCMVCFVPLAELKVAESILDAVVTALRLPPLPVPALPRITEALSGTAPCLLILDNFEHLLPVGATLVHQLVAAVPHMRCLVTSRQVLGLPEEREMPLRPLAAPPAQTVEPEHIYRFPSVQLFVDRARARRPDFQITPHNAAALAELLRRIEGLPLSIEICAARSNVLSPRQMLAQLESGGEFAADTRLGLTARQNSLRATFEWSYGLLPATLQCVLRHLSLFRGGFTLEAAQAVCGEIPVLAALAYLRDASLVQGEEIIVGPAHSEMRFSLLDTVRTFAAEMLSPEELATAQERHALYFLNIAEESLEGARTFAPSWQNMLEREQDNVVAAFDWSLQERLDLTLRFVVALQHYWATYEPSRGRAMLESVAARIAGTSHINLIDHGRVLRMCGEMAIRHADNATGKAWMQKSLLLSRDAHDLSGEAAALTSLGMIAMESGAYAEAKEHLQAAETQFRAAKDDIGLAWTLRHQGVLARRTCEYSTAQVYFDEALKLFQKHKNKSGEAWIFLALGELAMEQGKLEMALKLCERARHFFIECGYKTGLLWSLHRCGETVERLGDTPQARRCYEEGLNLARQLQNLPAQDVFLRALEGFDSAKNKNNKEIS